MLGIGWASGPVGKVVIGPLGNVGIAKLYRQAALDDHINTFNGSLLQMKMKEGTLKWSFCFPARYSLPEKNC